MQPNDTIPDTIPYGYCHCGCGEKTSMSLLTDKRYGAVKGTPNKFINGHNRRKHTRRSKVSGADEKVCAACGVTFPLDMFCKHSSLRDGLSSYCRPCDRARRRNWQKANPEKSSHARRKWRSNNREKHNACSRAWQRNNPDARRRNWQNYRARMIADGGSVSIEEWHKILDFFGGKCAKCGSTDHIQMDHVVPLSRGGSHSADNLQPLCRHCNISKHTKTEDYRGKLYRPAELPFEDDAD